MYVPGMCAWRVLSQNHYVYNSSTAAAVKLQEPVATVYACGWYAGEDQATTTTISRPRQQSNTLGRTFYHAHETYSRSESSSSFLVTAPDILVVR